MSRRDKFFHNKNTVSYRLVHNESGPSQFEDSAVKNVFLPTSNKPSKFDILFKQPINVKEDCPVSEKYPSKGPRPDWDPDVVAALDDDFDFEDPDNIIDDDFIAKANTIDKDGNVVKRTRADDEWETDDSCSDNFDMRSDDLYTKSEDAKSRFTQYSLTSAVTNCSENVKTFNEHFDKMLETYDDDQIGALDLDDVEGYKNVNSDVIEYLVNSEQARKKIKVPLDDVEIDKDKILFLAETDLPEKLTTVEIRGPIEGDCESVISTTSSKRFLPTVIKVGNDFPTTKISMNPAKILNSKLTKGMLKRLNEDSEMGDRFSSECSDSNVTCMSNQRSKHETPAERKERKKLFKEMKRENRIVKKENKIAFNQERIRQQVQAINSRRNMGLKL